MVWYGMVMVFIINNLGGTTSVPLSSIHSLPKKKRTGLRFQKKSHFLAVGVKVFLFHVRGVGSTGKKIE